MVDLLEWTMLLTNMFFSDTVKMNTILHVMIVQVQNPAKILYSWQHYFHCYSHVKNNILPVIFSHETFYCKENSIEYMQDIFTTSLCITITCFIIDFHSIILYDAVINHTNSVGWPFHGWFSVDRSWVVCTICHTPNIMQRHNHTNWNNKCSER
jgi:hypothetical protein